MDWNSPEELHEARVRYRANSEALARAQAQELAAMTDERARFIIQSLGAVEVWREARDSSGLVEQQAIFHKHRRP